MFEVGDIVQFDLSKNVGAAVYGRDGEIVNKLNWDGTGKGKIVKVEMLSLYGVNVEEIQIRFGEKIYKYYPQFCRDGYWVKKYGS